MPIFMLNENVQFPDASLADEASGILAVGGDLSPERLLLAYALGIFPWYDEDESPILWHAPRWRMVLSPDELHVGRTLRKVLRRGTFEVRYDTATEQVIRRCARKPRPGQDGTWLNPGMIDAYIELARLGHVHSAEAWRDGVLVGGLYGVAINGLFCGESMFSDTANASKVVFATCVRALGALGFALVDCQVHTEHLESLGAEEIPVEWFQERLGRALQVTPTKAWPE